MNAAVKISTSSTRENVFKLILCVWQPAGWRTLHSWGAFSSCNYPIVFPTSFKNKFTPDVADLSRGNYNLTSFPRASKTFRSKTQSQKARL